MNSLRKASSSAPEPSRPKPSPKEIEQRRAELQEQFLALFGRGADAEASPTLTKAFQDLEKAGHETLGDEPWHVQTSHESGFESLVRFSRPEGLVVSFRTEEDVTDYTAMVTGKGSAPASMTRAQKDLQTLEIRGESFYFARGGGPLVDFLPLKTSSAWLRTDAAGAAMLLARGAEVQRLGSDGSVQRMRNLGDAARAAAQPRPADTERHRLGLKLNMAEALGLEVAPDFELPENLKATDVIGMAKENIKGYLLSQFRDDPRYNSLLQRGAMTESLAAGGHIAVRLPGEEKARLVNGRQIDDLLTWVSAPTPEMKSFQKAFEALDQADAVVLGRGMVGMDTGQLSRADALGALLNLSQGGEVVVLAKNGDLHSLTQASHLEALQKAGRVPGPTFPPVDPAKPKTNLFMLYFVSPFDPLDKGIYEDLPLRLTKPGSNEHADVVTLRSDLPKKRSLRRDYVQPGELVNLERLPHEKLSMADPKVFEDFVYATVKEHKDDSRIRLMVAGHGGAEKGLLPDGSDNNAAAHNAMAVDDFAAAISSALDRVEKETGKRPKIDNLIVGSCLMGNTSFIHALAKRGDVATLSASPEVLMGNDPAGILEYISNPKTANADGPTFARHLVDVMAEASAFPGGKKNLQFADTYGAYDLDPAKDRAVVAAMDGFFQACLKNPEYARFVKEDIAFCPTYGVNQVYNVMMNVDERDLIQVAERIRGDARIGSEEIRKACDELIRAASDQVLSQKVSEKYEGRKGATLYLPVDGFDFDEAMVGTDLLKTTDYRQFMDLIFRAPLHRGAVETVFTEINRVTSGMRRPAAAPPATAPGKGGAAAAPPATAPGKPGGAAVAEPAKAGDSKTAESRTATKPAGAGAHPEPTSEAGPQGPSVRDPRQAAARREAFQKQLEARRAEMQAEMERAEAHQQVHDLEEPLPASIPLRLGRAVRDGARLVGALAGAAVGGALGFAIGAPVGVLLGARAGWTGRSVASKADTETAPSLATPAPAANLTPAAGAAAGAPAAPPVPGTPPGIAPSAHGANLTPAPGANAGTSPFPEDDLEPQVGLGGMVRQFGRVAVQAALMPSEFAGETVHRSASYAHGTAAGRLVGTPVGAAAGLLGGATAGSLIGGAAGAFVGRGIASVLTFFLPGPPRKPEPQGMDGLPMMLMLGDRED